MSAPSAGEAAQSSALTACVYVDRRPEAAREIILPTLERSPLIDEIIVFHARRETAFDDAGRRCEIVHRHADGGRLEDLAGLWDAWSCAKNDALLSLGDGVLCWTETVERLYRSYCDAPDVIHTPLGATLEEGGVVVAGRATGDVPLANLRCMLFDKRLAGACADAADVLFNMPALRETDMFAHDEASVFVSLVAVKRAGRLNKGVRLPVYPLEHVTGEPLRAFSVGETAAERERLSAFVRYALDFLELPHPSPGGGGKLPKLGRTVTHACRKLRHRVARFKSGRHLPPSFMIPGAPRCGTSFLFRQMCRHPRIEPPSRKEMMYYAFDFAIGEPVHARADDWNARGKFHAYRSRFPLKRLRRGMISGEASVQYFYTPEAPARIRADYPDMRFILALRNPIEQAWSSYWMFRMGRGYRSSRLDHEDSATILEALDRELRYRERGLPELFSGCRATQLARHLEPARGSFAYGSNYSYGSAGHYAFWLKHWLKFFRPEQFLVLQSEAMFAEPQATLDRVFRFLDLEPLALGAPSPCNETFVQYMPMPPEVRRRLADCYREANRELYALLDGAFAWPDETEKRR